MNKTIPQFLCIAVTLLWPALGQPPGSSHEGPAFEFEKIRDDIYQARGTGNMSVGSNAAILINERDVLLVDSHISPAAAWALLEELKQITDKPVRYVVNTHFHFDHLHGNEIYPEDVEIIGHEFTREMVVSGKSRSGRSYDAFVGSAPQRLAELQSSLEGETDPDRRSEIARQVEITRNYILATDAVHPTPPTQTLSERMTLHRGDREIRILFFGRGHTGGDVVVHLPKEKVLITGDLLTGGLPYMGDGYVREWVETLEGLKDLDFDLIVPGHGRPFRERRRIDYLQSFLQDLWTKATRLHARGLTAEEAAQQIDMRNHAEQFPALRQPGVDPHTMLRIYELLNGIPE